jgi:hypothetical protein
MSTFIFLDNACLLERLVPLIENSCTWLLEYDSADVFTLDAGLLAGSHYSEGPALIGHLGTGFSWFPSV